MCIAFVILIFLLALYFTWTSGMHQASAVAATAFGSHCLSKRQAIAIIFAFEVLGTIFGGSAVATAIQSLSGWPEQPSLLPLLASALLSAISWNYLSQKLKMPASSTHSLIGGMVGALVVASGDFSRVELGKFDLLHPSGLLGAVLSLFLSPTLGFAVSWIIFSLVLVLSLRASNKLESRMRSWQWLTTAALAFGDGQNDTQKTMGLMVLALNAGGLISSHEIPLWVRISLALSMGAGAFFLSPGLVKELAFSVYNIKPMHAIVSESSSAAVLIANSLIGGPVSASQVITTSVMGAGCAERFRGIHWLVIKDILLSWLVTIPAAAILAAIVHLLVFHWFSDALR